MNENEKSLHTLLTVWDVAEIRRELTYPNWVLAIRREDDEWREAVAMQGPEGQDVYLEINPDAAPESKERHEAFAYDKVGSPTRGLGPTPAAALLDYARNWEQRWREKIKREKSFRNM